MKIFSTILPALLFAATASAQDHDKFPGIKISPRSADEDFHPFRQGAKLGRRSEYLPIPNLFRRADGCPASAPNTCDTYWCAQVCCGEGNGKASTAIS